MRELITLSQSQIGNETIDTVNARDLHVFLESGQQFTDWISNRINRWSFTENRDYTVFHNSMNNPDGGRPLKDYFLTLDMAKELSMVERNAKGKQARQYFIECEKQLKAPKDLSKTDLAHMVIESEKEKLALEAKNLDQSCQINNLTPKAKAYESFLEAKGEVTLQNSMREINRRTNLGIKFIREIGAIFKQGLNNSTPKAEYIQRGYFVVRASNPDRDGRTYPQTLVTPRGVAWLDKIVPDDLRV